MNVHMHCQTPLTLACYCVNCVLKKRGQLQHVNLKLVRVEVVLENFQFLSFKNYSNCCLILPYVCYLINLLCFLRKHFCQEWLPYSNCPLFHPGFKLFPALYCRCFQFCRRVRKRARMESRRSRLSNCLSFEWPCVSAEDIRTFRECHCFLANR